MKNKTLFIGLVVIAISALIVGIVISAGDGDLLGKQGVSNEQPETGRFVVLGETQSGTFGVWVTSVTPIEDELICSGCGVCVDICPVEAIELTEESVPVVTFGVETVVGGTRRVAKVGDGCIGCGSCASYCPSGAMSLKHFRDKQVYAQLDYAI